MVIKFEKWHGNGNDFVILNTIDNRIKITKNFIKKISNRNKGIGFDQLIIAELPTKDNHDFFVRFFNADGSEANMCINGLRCAASYIWKNNFAPLRQITFMTKKNIIKSNPINLSGVSIYINKPEEIKDKIVANSLKKILKTPFKIFNIGNNHLCVKMNSIEKYDLDSLYIKLPASVKKMDINLSIYEIHKNKILIRTYENGVGETLSCGSASLCLASQFTEKTKSNVKIASIGGKLNFKRFGNGILITGDTNFIFEGNLND